MGMLRLGLRRGSMHSKLRPASLQQARMRLVREGVRGEDAGLP